MFNYAAIDKTPTILQIQSIIQYMVDDPDVKYNFAHMMHMTRPKPNVVTLDLNNAHFGLIYKVTFKGEYLDEIESFKPNGEWMS